VWSELPRPCSMRSGSLVGAVAATTPRGHWEEEVVVDVPVDLAVADLALDLTMDEDVTDGSSVLSCALLHVPDPLPGRRGRRRYWHRRSRHG
jgi:hypothetical protein